MLTPLILATSRKYDTKVDLMIHPTWDFSSKILESKYVNKIYENRFPTEKYDLFLQSFWGLYSDKLNFDEVYTIRHIDPATMHETKINLTLLENHVYHSQYLKHRKIKRLSNKKVVGIHSGCFGGVWKKKQWNKFIELVCYFLGQDFFVVNFGSLKEKLILKNGNSVNNENYLELAGKLPLPSTINHIAACDYFIANDSGLMHIADCLNIPLIALFGGTSIKKNRPVNENSQVLNGNLDCSPCQFTSRFNDCTDNQCLKRITVEHVIELMEKLKWI